MAIMKNMANGNRPQNPLKTFKAILRFIKKYFLHIVFALLGAIVNVGCMLGGTIMLRELLEIIEESILTGMSTAELMGLLTENAVIMIAIYLVGALGGMVSMRLLLTVSTGTLYDIRTTMFEKMEKLPVSYFDNRTHGEIMSQYTADTDALRDMISNGIPNLISSSLTLIGVFVLMFVFSPVLALFAVAMFAVMVVVVTVIAGKGSVHFLNQQAGIAKANGYIEEYIEGQKVVQVFCHEEKTKDGFRKVNEALCRSETSAQTYAQILMPIMGNLSYLNYVVTAIAGALMIGAGRLEGGAPLLISFLTLSRQFSMPLTTISQQFNGIMTALAGAERIMRLIETPPEGNQGYVTLVNAEKYDDGIRESAVRTGAWAWKHYHKATDTTTYTEWKGKIQFDHVNFAYVPEKPVLQDVSFTAMPGSKIALVGSTGAGKTTITNLLNRFYEVEDGKIRYDDINIQKIVKQDLRKSMAMVLQDVHLFTGTVRDNIRYGREDATDSEVEAAAVLANADEFIRSLPEGYDTVLTQDGANLSQGQRQLLSIARAAVADPPVLVLDEATSSIDTATEKLIENGMDSLMRGRTVFIIAHRLSTVRNADVILVIEGGRIVERGSHAELLEKHGRYFDLYTGAFELS